MTTQLVFSLPFVGARSPFSSSASCSLRMLFLHINTLTSLFSLSHLLLSLSFSSYYDCPFSFARASSLSQDGLSLANFEAFPLIQYDITSSSYGVKGEGRQQRQVEESPLLLGSWGLGRLAPMNTGLHATTILTRDSVSPQTPESEKEAKSTISDSAKEEKEKEEEQKEDTNREIPLSLIQDCVIKRLRDGSLSSKKSLVVLRISEISLSLLDFLLSKSLNLLLLLPPSPSHSVSGRSGEEENERKKKDRHEEENVSMEEGARIEDKKRRPHLLTKKAKEEEEKMTGKIHEIEQYLLHRYLPGLCLFAVETLELSQVYRHLQQRQREKMISHQEGQLFYQRSSPFHPSNLLEKTLLSSLSIQRIPPPSFHPFASYLQQAKRLTPFQIHGSNLFAWLAGKKITDKPQSKSPSHTAGGVDEQPGISRTHFSSSSSPPPAIALVANYDAFAAAPHLAVGAHQNGSGVAAVLELARILSRLYGEGDEAAEEDKDPANTKKRNFGSPNRRGKYSFLFLLTDAGASDFAGASAFLNQLEPTLLQSIQYVLCLDDLIPSSSSSSTVMYLHTAKKYKNAHVQTLLSLLENFLKKNGIDSFVLKPRKIVVQQAPLKPRRQHEHFTMRKLISGTLSAKSDEEAKENLWTRSSLIDSQPLDEESEKAFTAVTTAVAETLASLTYSLDDKEDRKEQGGERHEKEQKGEVEEVEIIRGSYGVSTAHLNAWVSLASKTPRFYAYQSLARSVKKSEGGGSIPFQEEIETSFRRSGLIPQTQTFSLEPFSNISFTYEPPLYMAVLETRPVFFDILLLLLSLAYCFSIYYTLAGWDLLLPGLTRLLNTASSLFSKGTSQMLKAAKGGTTGGDEE